MTSRKESKYLIAEAEELLAGAKEEMQRAREDVAAFRVCHSSRQATLHYLSAYLLDHDLWIPSLTTVKSLLDQCRQNDARFHLIDLSPMECRSAADHSAYCLQNEKVEKCLHIADQLAGMIKDHPPSY